MTQSCAPDSQSLGQLALVNGQWCAHVGVRDRGLTFGDGLFETMLVYQSQVPLLHFHLTRLLRGARALRFPLNEQTLRAQIQTFIEAVQSSGSPDQKFILKVLVTRGVGGTGYVPNLHAEPSVIVLARPHGVGIRRASLVLCDHPVTAIPALYGIKHTSRLDHILAGAKLAHAGYEALSANEYVDGLLLDAAGNVVEALHHNVFWVSDDELYTPDISLGGVDGVLRQVLIQDICPRLQITPRVVTAELDHMARAQSVFITNAVKGVIPVRQLVMGTKHIQFGICEMQRKVSGALLDLYSVFAGGGG